MSDTDQGQPLSYRDDPEFLPWLKTQEGFKDLFTAPADDKGKPVAPATGGGDDVPSNQMQGVATSIVKAITEAAILAGRKEGAAAVVPPAAGAPAAPPRKLTMGERFFGKEADA
jgi:hypothetical protein